MLYYLLIKKSKGLQTIHRLKRLNTQFEHSSQICTLLMLPIEHQLYLLIQIDDIYNRVIFSKLLKYLSVRNVQKFGHSSLSEQETKSLIQLGLQKQIREPVVLKPGLTINIPWGSKIRSGLVKSISGGFVYTNISQQGYPMIAKIQLEKIKTLNPNLIQDTDEINTEN